MYNAGSANELMYSYTQPAANKEGTAPLPVPNAAGAVVWNILNAIGGSPVLIKNDVVKITDAEELIVVDNTIQRARTAIGYNADGKVLILVVEGNNPAGAKGLNLQDLAALLKSMGCTNALNLDGGGSTSMVVNGQLTVKPSDAAGERPVMSMLLLKKKQ
jgi:exopolysaccharide biosynthesis protein